MVALIVTCVLLLFTSSLEFVLCSGTGMMQVNTIILSIGKNLGQHVTKRLTSHLEATGVQILTYEHQVLNSDRSPTVCAEEGVTCLLLGLGNSLLTNLHLPLEKVEGFTYESFSLLRKLPNNNNEAYPVLVANGRPMEPNHHPNATKKEFRKHIDYGAVTGSYCALEWLGFAFLHPLRPYIPSSILVNMTGPIVQEQHEAPRWPDRNFHIHTQHPLELNEVLQGMDVPMLGKGVLHANCEQDHNNSNPGQNEGKHFFLFFVIVLIIMMMMTTVIFIL